MNGSDIQKEIFKRMTPEQRLKAAMRLDWSARRLTTGPKTGSRRK